MTAAVARPPLFRHLLASNPEDQKGSFAATASAVVLHAAIVVAAVALTARVQAPTAKPDITEYIAVTDFPNDAPTVKPGGGTNVGGPIAPALPRDIQFTPPTDVPKEIPPHGSMGDLLKALENMSVARPNTGPVVGTGSGTDAHPGPFVPVTVKPELLNRMDIARAAQRLYPQTLLQAGVGGTALVWLHVDENGLVIDTRLKVGSGFNLLDEAALKVAQTARFSPAYNRDQRVRVWVELPIVFGTR